MFLGGWHAPWPLSLIDGANSSWWPVLWFVAKVWGFMFLFMWLRATLPRLRYDQFMRLGWEVLIPVALVWIVIVGVVQALALYGYGNPSIILGVAGLVVSVGSIALVGVLARRTEPPKPMLDKSFDPMAGGFPVPPLPGQRLDAAPFSTTKEDAHA
jgi:NADH-quinone oxidoreductase subunit H